MGLFDFFRKKKQKKTPSDSNYLTDEEEKYILEAEDKPSAPKVHMAPEEARESNNQTQMKPNLDYYQIKIQTELHLKDYVRASSLYHEIEDYTNELNMLLLEVEAEKNKGNFYFALEYLNKAKGVVNSYCKDKNSPEIKEIQSRIKKLEPYLKSKKELSDRLSDAFKH